MVRHVDDSHGGRLSDPVTLAEAQGWFNIIGGAWPLVSIRTFEAVFGPKDDRWLEYTVAGLLVTNGACQVMAARQGDIGTAQRLGGGTALTLLAVDLVFVPAGRIRWTYLLDAVFEVGWLGLWAKARR